MFLSDAYDRHLNSQEYKIPTIKNVAAIYSSVCQSYVRMMRKINTKLVFSTSSLNSCHLVFVSVLFNDQIFIPTPIIENWYWSDELFVCLFSMIANSVL